MNIQELEAGPELDALVAERVMGWTELSLLFKNYWGQSFYKGLPSLGFPPGDQRKRKTIGGYGYWKLNKAVAVPCYSTDIAAAWQVVQKMNERMKDGQPVSGGAELVLIQDETSAYRSRWWARFDGRIDVKLGGEGWVCASDHGEGFAPAMAICLAALEAMVDEE